MCTCCTHPSWSCLAAHTHGCVRAGVVGGIVGLALLALVAWLFAVRKRTGRWALRPGARVTGPPERALSGGPRARGGVDGSVTAADGSLISTGALDSTGTAGALESELGPCQVQQRQGGGACGLHQHGRRAEVQARGQHMPTGSAGWPTSAVRARHVGAAAQGAAAAQPWILARQRGRLGAVLLAGQLQQRGARRHAHAGGHEGQGGAH